MTIKGKSAECDVSRANTTSIFPGSILGCSKPTGAGLLLDVGKTVSSRPTSIKTFASVMPISSTTTARCHCDERYTSWRGYFKREFRYDYNEYPLVPDGFDPREAWLWVADEYTNLRAIGAALFHQDRLKAPAGSERDWQWAWVLEFVWLHPYKRGQGLFSASWEGWQARYPGFVVEQPWSPTMEGFLERHPHVYYDGTATADILARLRSK